MAAFPDAKTLQPIPEQAHPNISGNINPPDHFEIVSGFQGMDKINVTAIEIPFWSMTDVHSIDDRLFDFVQKSLSIIMNKTQAVVSR